MAERRPPYAPEYRRQTVELVRAAALSKWEAAAASPAAASPRTRAPTCGAGGRSPSAVRRPRNPAGDLRRPPEGAVVPAPWRVDSSSARAGRPSMRGAQTRGNRARFSSSWIGRVLRTQVRAASRRGW